MIDSHVGCAASDEDQNRKTSARPSTRCPEKMQTRSKSMHDGIAVWCDCCSCEAEPYWVAVAEEMGIDLGSDYEDTPGESTKDR